MFLKLKLKCFRCLGLDSLASYKNKPWALDPVNPFLCDYPRTPRITHTNIQNRCSELDKRYPFPRILCPVLASKLFLCFTKILLPMWLILFQASVPAILREVQEVCLQSCSGSALAARLLQGRQFPSHASPWLES